METGRMPRNRQWGDVDLVIRCILHQFLLITCVTPVSLGCLIPAPHVHQKAQAERRKKSWQGAGAVLCSFFLYPRTQKSAPKISVSLGINSLHFKSFIGLKAHLKNREIQGGMCTEGLHGTAAGGTGLPWMRQCRCAPCAFPCMAHSMSLSHCSV